MAGSQCTAICARWVTAAHSLNLCASLLTSTTVPSAIPALYSQVHQQVSLVTRLNAFDEFSLSGRAGQGMQLFSFNQLQYYRMSIEQILK